MQIQCPHCKSRYRLGAEVIDAYGGFVRCGNCNYKFNIHDQVILDDEQSKLVNTETRPSQDAIEAKPDEEQRAVGFRSSADIGVGAGRLRKKHNRQPLDRDP